MPIYPEGHRNPADPYGFYTIFEDQFDDGILSIPNLPGNGSIAETGGNLVLSLASGEDGNWRNGRIAFAPFQTYDDDRRYFVESEFVGGNLSGDNQAWFGLWQDENNVALIYASDLSGTLYAYKIINGTWTAVATGPAPAWPVRIRVVFRRDLYYSEGTSISWQYYNGSAWTEIANQQIDDFQPHTAFMYARNWNALPATEVQFGYVKVETLKALTKIEEDERQSAAVADNVEFPRITQYAPSFTFPEGKGLGVPGPVWQGTEEPEPVATKASPSDFEEFPDITGVTDHGGVGQGLGEQVPRNRVPFQPEDFVEFRPLAKWYDPETGLPTNVNPEFAHHGFPEESPLGTESIPSKTGVEDTLGYSLAEENYTYADEIYDDDGKEFVDGSDIRGLFYYDATQDPWHSPTPGDGFYGAGRDGQYYADGEPCGFGDFGTLAGGFRRTAFMNDVEPGGIRSQDPNGSVSLVGDDVVRLSVVNTGSWQYFGLIRSTYRWYLIGDFDLQVEFLNYSSSGGSDGGLGFEAVVDYDNYFYIRRNGPLGRIDSDVRINAGWGRYVSHGSSVSSGKLRLVRSGNSVTTYYDVGGGWVLLRSAITNDVFYQPMHINFFVGGNSVTSMSCDLTNLTLASGTTTNLAGWAREVAGTHRGLASEFPEHALIICADSPKSVNIIDADTEKLWMRFIGGSGYALGDWMTDARPRRARMSNGILLVPFGGSSEGAGIFVNFMHDEIFLHREEASGVTGGLFRMHNGYYYAPAGAWGRDVSTIGQIASRHVGGGYSGDRNRWRIPDYVTWDADIVQDGSWSYRAWVTDGGLTLNGFKPGYMEGDQTQGEYNSEPLNCKYLTTDPAYWVHFDRSTKKLFWSSESNLYEISQANWLVHLGVDDDTIVPDNIKALHSGTISDLSQRYGVTIGGSTVYLPSDEGIWKINWPAGSWTLEYGKPGSGATHEILPDHQKVRSIAYAEDSGDLLLFGLLLASGDTQWGAIRLASNALYGLKTVKKASVAPRLAVQAA